MAEVFDLENLNPGYWFEFGEAKVQIRDFDQEVMNTINEACVTKRTEIKQIRKRGPLQPVEITETDDRGIENMLWDYCIMAWEGITDPKGNDIECTKENKIKLMRGSPKFYQFVDDSLSKLDEVVEQQKEVETKNSSRSQIGPSD